MFALLGLCSAVLYGAADFLGGAASRRTTVYSALAVSMPVGLLVLAAGALAAGGAPTGVGLLWGLGAGLAGATGLITFYRALALGPMSVVAPVSALTAAMLPVAVGVARGERLHEAAIFGVLLCLAAIALVSLEKPTPGGAPRRGGPAAAALSGAGFGVYFVLLKEAGPDGGLWPIVSARVSGLAVLALTILALRRPVQRLADRGTAAFAVTSGILDAVANIVYFAAAQRGLLSLAAVLTSLYPAVTVLLARTVYSERLRAVQALGLGVALAGIALVTVG